MNNDPEMAAIAPELPVDGVLDDGTKVLFRPITPDDKERLQRGMEELSEESRYRRFFAAVDHLSEEQLRYFTELDWEDHFAWLAVLPDTPGQPGVGVARAIRLPDDPAAAEAAVTVIDSYQRRGVGRALLQLLARSAIERGIGRFIMMVLGDNEPMLSLMHRLGAESDGMEGSVVRMHVALPATIQELDQTPAPRVLRATAQGQLEGRAGPRGVGIHFHRQQPEAESN